MLERWLGNHQRSRTIPLATAWVAFYLICFGLGYPTLNRFDPTRVAGLADTQEYFQAVIGDAGAPQDHVGYRVMVPYLARPIYKIAKGHVGSWNPVSFSLLVVNCAFCATSATLLLFMAQLFGLAISAGWIAAFAYLLNFNVANDQLAGLVDSSEACLIIVLILILQRRAWRLLPLIGAIGPLAKETFVPIALLFTLGWVWKEDRRPWIHILAMVAAGAAVVLLVPLLLTGHLVSPVQTLIEYKGMRWHSFLDPLVSWVVWLTLLWLVPFVALGAKHVPRAIFPATLTALAGVYLMGVWADMGASISRPLFNVAGAGLCLAFAAGISPLLAPGKTIENR